MPSTKDKAYFVGENEQRYRLKKVVDSPGSRRTTKPEYPTTLYEKNPEGGWDFLKNWETDMGSRFGTDIASDKTVMEWALEYLETVHGVRVSTIILDDASENAIPEEYRNTLVKKV